MALAKSVNSDVKVVEQGHSGILEIPSNSSLTKEDLEECMQDFRLAVNLTLTRLSAVSEVYRLEVEERYNIAANKKEAELKYLLLNVCREAQHILVALSRPAFTGESIEGADNAEFE